MNPLRRRLALWVRNRSVFLTLGTVTFGGVMYLSSLKLLPGLSSLPIAGQLIALGVAFLIGYLWAWFVWGEFSRHRIFDIGSPIASSAHKGNDV